MAMRVKKRGGWKYKNLNISRAKRAFSMKQKAFFVVFEGLSFGAKKADTSFNKQCQINSCLLLQMVYHFDP